MKTYFSLKTTHHKKQFILTESTINYNKPQKPKKHKPKPKTKRTKSQLGTDDYNRSLRRSFSRAKQLAYFNPDLTHFITLTYSKNHQDPKQTIQHIKNLIKHQQKLHKLHTQHTKKNQKETSLAETPRSPGLNSPTRGMKPSDAMTYREPQADDLSSVQKKSTNRTSLDVPRVEKLKYIYVMELQKRGAVHVHMICNDYFFTEWVGTHKNVKGWLHGFSDVKTIDNFDSNFRPYLYLFKYMTKAERVGDTFLHTSRTFDKIKNVVYDDYINKLAEENVLFEEDYEFLVNETSHRINKRYIKTD